MTASKPKAPPVTVHIHNDFCSAAAVKGGLEQIGRIVSRAYARRSGAD